MAVDQADFLGGNQVYNPQVALLAVTHPQVFAALATAHGIEPPGDDFMRPPDTPTTRASLGKALAMAAPSGSDRPAVGGTPAAAFVPSLPPSKQAPEQTPPQSTEGQTPNAPALGPGYTPGERAVQREPQGYGDDPALPPPPRPPIPRPLGEGDIGGPVGAQPGEGVGPGPEDPNAIQPTLPSPFMWPKWIDPQKSGGEPTPAPESAPATGPVPPGSTAPPGDLNTPEPGSDVPLPRPRPPEAPQSDEGDGSGGAPKGGATGGPPSKKDRNTSDDLAKVLAGVHAMQPNLPPPHVSSPPPFHPNASWLRSNINQALLQDMMGLSKPQPQFRLGEALRGKAYS